MKILHLFVSMGLLCPTSVIFHAAVGVVAVEANLCGNPRNCPCSYAARYRENSRLTPGRIVNETLTRTSLVLSRIVNERFRGDSNIVRSLQNCLRSVHASCVSQYLRGECSMSGLPSVHHVEHLSQYRSLYSQRELLRDTRDFLSRLAVYVDHAKKDEQQHVFDPMRSLADDIQRIENDGIYQLMCDMDASGEFIGLRHDPTIGRGLNIIQCAFGHQVSRDNRNYVVFYTLDRLLHSIGY